MTRHAIADRLTDVIATVRYGSAWDCIGQDILDANGNRVGKWEVTESAKTQDIYASLADLYASLVWHVSQHGAVAMDQKRLDDAFALLNPAKKYITQEDAQFFNDARSAYAASQARQDAVKATFTAAMSEGRFIHFVEHLAEDNAGRLIEVLGSKLALRFSNGFCQYILDGRHVGYGLWHVELTVFMDAVRENQKAST